MAEWADTIVDICQTFIYHPRVSASDIYNQVCASVRPPVQATTFESLLIETSCYINAGVFTISRSILSIKVTE